MQVSPFKNDMRYKENEKYLARVQASVDAERSHRDKVKLEREKKREYQATRAALQQLVEEERAQKQQEKNDRASEFWIATVGVGVVSFINTIKRGFTNAVNQSALTIHAYSLTTRKQVILPVLDLLQTNTLPNLETRNGQVRYKDLLFPAGIYYFVKYHWEETQ